eukprot:1766763-Rhodomonas_salina.1
MKDVGKPAMAKYRPHDVSFTAPHHANVLSGFKGVVWMTLTEIEYQPLAVARQQRTSAKCCESRDIRQSPRNCRVDPQVGSASAQRCQRQLLSAQSWADPRRTCQHRADQVEC